MGDMKDVLRRCKFFEKGNCRKESSCQFLHVSSGDSREEADLNMDLGKFMKKQRQRNCAPTTSLCKFFVAGNCRNGANCKFLHATAESGREDMQAKETPPGLIEEGNTAKIKKNSKKKPSKGTEKVKSEVEEESSKQISLALSLALAGKAKEAERIILALKESHPQVKHTSKMRLAEGVLCYYDADIDAAIMMLEKVEAGGGEVGEWLVKSRQMRDQFLLGNNLGKQHQSYSAALEVYNKCLELDPFNLAYMAKVFWRRALLHEAHSYLEKAEADLTAAMAIEPENLRVLTKRASVRIEMKQFDAALQDLEVLQGLQPSKESRRKIEAIQKKKALEEKKLKEDAEKKKAYEERKEEREKEKREGGRKNTFRNENRRSGRERRSEREFRERSDEPSHYEILGVEESASVTAIRAAFREKAKEFHPDRHSNAEPEERARVEEKMKEVAAAHSCLSDPEQRENYDRKLAGGDDDDFEDFDFGGLGDFMFDFLFGRGRCDCRWCR